MRQKSKKTLSFLQNSLKDTLSRFHYFQCPKIGLHHGQKLNYVCISRQCKARGLICSICRQDHASHDHDVIPLKHLISQISQIKDTLPKEFQEQRSTREYLEILENSKNEILYFLRFTVQQLAVFFQNFEEQIMTQFRESKIKLLNQIGLNSNLKGKIEEVLENVKGDKKIFKTGIDELSNILHKTGKKSEIDFKSNIPELINSYQTWAKQKIDKISQVLTLNKSIFCEKDTEIPQFFDTGVKEAELKDKEKKNFNNFFQKDDLEQQKQEMKKSSLLIMKSSKSSQLYTFSSFFKSNTIVIEKNESSARQNKYLPAGRFVLVNEGLGLKKQSISFKMTNLAHWIGVGICIRDKMVKNKYKFEQEKLGYGSYLVASNGFTFSHSEQSENRKNENFQFLNGEIIDVYLMESELKFVRREGGKSLSLKVSMSKNEWSSVCFCANLCSAPDEVEIVEGPEQLEQRKENG